MPDFFQDIIDTASIRSLMESLQQATGIPVSLLDHDGNMLVSAGWQDICAIYHRRHLKTAERCRENDRFFSEFLRTNEMPEEGFIQHTCKNGLIEIGLPIVINDFQFATLLFGQFLPEPVDYDFYRKNAADCGVDEDEYLKAIVRVPVYDQALVDKLLAVYSGIVELLIRLGKTHIEEAEARKELVKSESKFRSIIDSSPMGVFLYQLSANDNLILTAANPAADKILDIDNSALLGKTIEEAFPGLIDTEIPDIYRDLCRSGGTWNSEQVDYEDERITGAFEVHAFQTAPRTMAVFFLDITERKQAEQSLKESEEKYRLLFSAETDAIVIFESKTLYIVEANKSASALYGYSHEELLGMQAIDLSAKPEYSREKIIEVAQLRRQDLVEGLHKKKDGTVFPVEIAAGMFEWHGEPLHVAIIRDISERERITRMKDEMLSSISHEMRTPLTAILGFTELLLQENLEPDKIKQFLELSYQEGERLRELIDDLLDLQRLRAGFVGNQYNPLRIRSLLQEIAGIFADVTQEHDITIHCPDNLPDIVADEQKIHRVLKNLMSNAVKYSPGGGPISLTAKLLKKKKKVSIAISDRGLGIPAEALDQLFDRFFRVYHPEIKNIGGTGLGLALVKEIVKIHEGDVRVESAPGKGSTFFVDLPIDGPIDKS